MNLKRRISKHLFRQARRKRSNTQLTGFVARGPRASQRCTISKDVESS